MQSKRNSGRRSNPYVRTGGVAPRNAIQEKGGKQKIQRNLKRMILLATVAALLILGVYGVTQLARKAEAPVRLNCLSTDRIEAFGEDLLYYNGIMLTCVGPNGSIRWQFQLGPDADFYTAHRMVVAWVANQLYVINANGASTFNDRMSETVQFARIGESYVAAFLGNEDNGTIRVMDHQGNFLEALTVDNLFMTDIGFFGAKERLMWTTGLDIKGIAPITTLATYEPGRLAAGAVNLADQLIYAIYTDADNRLMLVNTQEIAAYDYKCKADTSIGTTLIYGWQLQATRMVGKTRYVLLQPVPEADGTTRTYELRLLTNRSKDEIMRLPGTCFAGALGERGVYGFGHDAIYYARYGSRQFTTRRLTFPISDVIGILDKGRAIVASGSDVFILQLPR